MCRLSGGPATALNVMTERGSFGCRIARLDPVQGLPRAEECVVLLVCAAGGIDTDLGRLGPLDALIAPPRVEVGVEPGAASARAVVVSVWRSAG